MFNNKYITRYNVISKQTLHFSTILLFNSDHGISSNSYFFRLFVSITIEKGGRGGGGRGSLSLLLSSRAYESGCNGKVSP